MDLVKTIIERLCAHLELLKQASNSAWKPLEVESFLGAILDSESVRYPCPCLRVGIMADYRKRLILFDICHFSNSRFLT